MIQSKAAAVSFAFATFALVGAVGADDTTPCTVDVVRAPDDVRAAIYQWLASERRCGTPLTVRVIADEGRLFVLAHDDRGRIFEREAPDAESVAALVASWSAPVDTPATTPPVRLAPVVDEDAAGDGARAATLPGRGWLGFGASVGEESSMGLGAHARYDALRAGRWSGGVAASIGMSSGESWGVAWQAQVATFGLEAAWTLSHDAWRGRAHVGLGWSVSRSTYFYMSGDEGWLPWGTGAQVGLGAEVERTIAGRWAGFVGLGVGVGRETLGDALHDMTDFGNDQRYVSGSAGVALAL